LTCLILPHFNLFLDNLKRDKLCMFKLLIKKLKKINDKDGLDARYWIQMALLNKNYVSTKN